MENRLLVKLNHKDRVIVVFHQVESFENIEFNESLYHHLIQWMAMTNF